MVRWAPGRNYFIIYKAFYSHSRLTDIYLLETTDDQATLYFVFSDLLFWFPRF